MGPAVSLADAAQEAGIVVAALLAGVVVLAPAPRARAVAAAFALLLTPVLLVAEIWDTPQFEPLRDRPVVAALLGLAGVAAVAAAALAIDRQPLVLPLAAVAVLPFRIPVASGGETANLLVPLYLVVAAGTVAFIVSDLRGRALSRDRPPGEPGTLEWLLLGLVVLYAVQATYSSSFSRALEQVVFFYVPFALLFALLVRYEWTPRLLRAALLVLVGLALLLALVGFVEYATRTLLLNPRVISSNQFQSYFRVNSLFFDPNIYGRFLVVVMTLLAAVLLWGRERRQTLLAGGALAVLWGALVLTLSQSSLAALLVALGILAALRFDWRPVAVVAAAALAAGALVVAAFPGELRLNTGRGERSLNDSTSGRADLIRGGIDLFAERPLQGWGAGAFEEEFRRERKTSNERAAVASHTIPITVAAEQGVGGLLLYLVVLLAAFVRLLRGARAVAARAAVAGAFAALVIHTWLYAAFLEDPLSWALLAVGTAVAVPVARRAPAATAPARAAPAGAA
jgi:O-antigen ligase